MAKCPHCKEQIRPVSDAAALPEDSGYGISGITWVCPKCEVILGVSEVDFLWIANNRDSTAQEVSINGVMTNVNTLATSDPVPGPQGYNGQHQATSEQDTNENPDE